MLMSGCCCLGDVVIVVRAVPSNDKKFPRDENVDCGGLEAMMPL
jgi:hypothetical protein